MSQQRLVHIVDDVPELREAVDGTAPGPVLVVALEGFLDAGNATALLTAFLAAQPSASSGGRVVASFDVDELHDYRARRPPVTFHENRYTDYDAPRLAVRLLTDEIGTPYLLLTGPEPDIRWEAFCRAVREVVDAFAVRLVVSLGSVPMAVPHTRPVQITNHANAERLLIRESVWSGEIRIPSSAQALLELRLGEWGHPACGFVAHIPHYLAQLDYPDASVELLRGLAEASGLAWDPDVLVRAGQERQVEIAGQIADSEEVRAVVAGLEQQYDAFHAGAEDSLLAEDRPLPSGEELGAQFERFLAGLDDDQED
ncbi:MAG: proteasome assembly chaperone family protein [Marmoricola sp.]